VLSLAPERVLFVTRDDATGEALGAALDAFARFLLLHLAVREGVRVLEGAGAVRAAWCALFVVCLLLSLARPWLRAACLVALATVAWKLVWLFPNSSNHFLLEGLCLAMLCSIRHGRPEDRADVRAALRWLPILVLFWSGLNKLVYGTYFNGAFLASILPSRSFAFVFGFVLPDAELQALLATPRSGPFAFESWPALLLSNGIYLGEMAAAVLLLLPATRLLGVALAILVIGGIEVGARELMFGTLMLNLLALYLPARFNVRLLPASAAAYALLLATRAWIAPDWSFN